MPAPRRFCCLLCCSLIATWSSHAVAQPAEPAAPTRQAMPASEVPPALPNAPAADADALLNTLPAIEDPMLAVPERPDHVLISWRQALQLIRARSTTLAGAQADVAFAAAQARLALSRAYPSLVASGAVNRHLLLGTGTNITAEGPQINVPIPDPATVWSASVALRQPVFDLRLWHDAGTAKLQTKASALRAEESERLVLASVADTIVAVVTAERLVEVSRVALRSSLSLLDLTRRRARLGAANAIDVLRAEQEVALNRAQLITATESLERSREALGMALGYAEAWGVSADVRLDELAADAQAVCQPLDALADRADVAAARLELKAAQRSVTSSEYSQLPTLDLTSNLTYTTAPFTSNGKPVQWTIGGLLTIPLYDGGSRYAEKHSSLAAAQNASARWTQAKRQAELELKQALRGVAVAQQNFEVSQKARQIAAETARLLKISFVNGRATSFELVDAMRRQQQAELDIAVQEFEVVRARILALLAQANCEI